jgi:ribosomal-protein-alanine N-acetyltransferase
MIYRIGDGYYVRAFRESDLGGPYLSWFEDQDVCRFNSHGKFFPSEGSFRAYVASQGSMDRIVWAVCHERDGHIGNVSLQNISMINRNAELALLLGDKRHWKKGVGKMAATSLIAHGFAKLNLERIYCDTAATNLGMRNLAVAIGFSEEGCRRMHLFLEGDWVDVIEYGLLRSESKSTPQSFPNGAKA